MERISKYQLGAMIILFQIGSTPLFELGIKAKQDAWLVILFSCLSSVLLLSLFLAIQRREPDKNLFQLLIRYFGRFPGWLATLLYGAYFSYESMRNVRDFGELTVISVLSDTPIFFIMLVMMLLSGYAIYKGVEVFFRFAEFLVAGVLIFYMTLMIMYFISGDIHLDYLLPIMENGFTPILKSSINTVIWFPFGQMYIFLVFWSLLDEKKALVKTSFRAYFISAAVVLIMNIINLVVLGPDYAEISTVPLLQSVQLIQIAEVFERFDAVIILLFYVGILIKATLWFMAAVVGLGQLFHTNYRKFIIPVGAVIYAAAFFPQNYQQHLAIGTVVAEVYRINQIFILVIPVALYIVMLLRRKKYASRDLPADDIGENHFP